MSHIAIVLAAGQGTRMRSPLAKVLHAMAGRPMLDWVLASVAATGPARTVVVVGHEAEAVATTLPSGVEACLQDRRLGTGHAVSLALAGQAPLDPSTAVLVVPGDTPLVSGEALAGLLGRHRETGAAVTLLTARVADPTGYGRVVRGPGGAVESIVEDRDADEATRVVAEVNAGMYVFTAGLLIEDLAGLRPDNTQGEYYLTDVIRLHTRRGDRVEAVEAAEEEVAGVNTQAQLAAAEAVLRRRILERWMGEGVRVIDPGRVYLDHAVALAGGVTLYPGVHLEGATVVEAGAIVGPEVFAVDSRIGPGAHVWYSVLRRAEVGENAEVGPYASLRPGTVLRARAKAGTFVEMKNTEVGEGAKVPHLTYLGDAAVGERANVGAGTITCNYDGYEKHRTEIGAGAFIGSDTMLVAPVSVGEGAVTGAGSVITRDVAPGALAVERGEQKEIPGYAARRAARHRAGRRDEG